MIELQVNGYTQDQGNNMVRRKSEPNGWFVMHACAMSAINLTMTGTQKW